MNKIILDLCGGTGAWSKPYKDNGYDVRNITLPKYDIEISYPAGNNIVFMNGSRKNIITIEMRNIYGILAAPPCTQFSFARTNAKQPRNLYSGMHTVKCCLDIIHWCQYGITKDTQKFSPLKFWALENPNRGMLKWFLGKPAFIFNPYDFGDNYKKETALWGCFNEPKKNPIKCTGSKFDYMKSKDIHPEFYGKYNRKARRAITPEGFAQAFYEANK